MSQVTITPLGTVSPYCKNDHNCPGFLIENKGKKILLDCGSGISRLLKFPEDLNDLIIIISHLHKDHYSDLSSFAYGSYVYNNLGYINKKIKVYIPSNNLIGNKSYNERDYKMTDYNYLMSYGKENYLEFITYNDKDKINESDSNISFSINPHQIETYATKIETEFGTIVYSSDTGFENNSLEYFAKDANMLICESSLLIGQPKKEDNHLYAWEAATIAKKANVDQLVLTHFWPEINKDNYLTEAKEVFNNTIIAEEGKSLMLRREK